MKHIHVIVGPTASGKTSRAIEYAIQNSADIVNFDSRQVYKKTNIVTGKDVPLNSYTLRNKHKNIYDIGYYTFSAKRHRDTALTNRRLRVWLLDIIDPRIQFSTWDYNDVAVECLKTIFTEKQNVVLVGGTYFYLKTLLYTNPPSKIKKNVLLRQQLESKSVLQLQEILKQKNSSYFLSLNKSEQHNPQRLIRNIEILDQDPAFKRDNNSTFRMVINRKIGLEHLQITFDTVRNYDKTTLQDSIAKRVRQRIEDGAINEYEQLHRQGYTLKEPGLQAIGYKCIDEYLSSPVTSIQDLENKWIRKEMQYAKRQITFMQNDPHLIE